MHRFNPAMEQRVRAAENAWNNRDIQTILLGHTIDCQWRNRVYSLWGREQIRAFLERQMRREIDRRVILEIWAEGARRLGLRLAAEFRNDSGIWFRDMARPREFKVETAIEAAVAVFREHGFQGTSAQMLVDVMGIGRQSLYDTFGDKWGLYRAAVKLYSDREVRAHADTLAGEGRAIDAIRAMLNRVAAEADQACLGLGSTVEFGCAKPDLVAIRQQAGAILSGAIAGALVRAREQGDLAADLDLDQLEIFLTATIASIRLAARAGASREQLAGLVAIAMRALR